MGNLQKDQYDTGKVFKLAAIVVILIVSLFALGSLVENVGANEVCVIQGLGGGLHVYTTPGPKLQMFGKVTTYQKRSQFSFSAAKDQGDKNDQSIVVRFNDGGHAKLSGVINWEMPTDYNSVVTLHQKYGSQDAIDSQLVRPTIEKAVYMTGPLMSSKESANEKRTDLLAYIEDQTQNGVYKTYTEDQKVKDAITGEEKTVSVVKLVTNQTGQFARQDESPLKTFSIRTFGLSLNNVKYDDAVEAQIQQQQQAIMQVQTAIANAKKAEQDAITAQKNGEANAAKAKWEQEVIKAKQVTEAEARLAVAKLNNEAAEQEKQALIKKGEGEGTYRAKVMNADGGLEKKLNAYVEVQKAYAAALASGNVKITPDVVMGGGQNGNFSGQNYIELMGLKAAHDLAIDVNARTGAAKK